MDTVLKTGRANQAQRLRLTCREQCRQIYRSRYLLLLLLPGVLYYVVFHYLPMYGVIISFKNFNMFDGILKSPWADHFGFGHFAELFHSQSFFRAFKNTVILSLLTIAFTFPAPIILAVSLNEVSSRIWKSAVQTASYLPHFISTVVICGIVFNMLATDGLVNHVIGALGGPTVQFMIRPEWFRGIYVGSEVWQTAGWNSILYTAALAGVDISLYEAARLDGANRWQRIWHIDLPSIVPTAIILLIFSIGGIMTMGCEKVLLLYNPNTYETADVIGTYVYRRGIVGADFSYSTAAGLFQSLIGFLLIVGANRAAKKFNEISLW